MRMTVSAILTLIFLAGCAKQAAEQTAVQVDPTLALNQAGDAAMSCEAIDAGIARMNARITLAQRMTDQEVNGRTNLSAPTNDTRVTSTTSNGHNGPVGIGNGTLAQTNGTGAESNEMLMTQKGTAEAAIARANELIRLAKAKHCYAT